MNNTGTLSFIHQMMH